MDLHFLFATGLFCESDLSTIASVIEQAIPKSMLFTYHLQTISFDEWQSDEADISIQLQSLVIGAQMETSSPKNNEERMHVVKHALFTVVNY